MEVQTIEEQLKEEIMAHYRDDYYDKAKTEKSGLM
jgi:hypothetical protein